MPQATDSTMEILSGYQFRSLEQLALARARIQRFAADHDLRGTVLLAGEGINFSLCGSTGSLDAWLAWLADRLDCDRPLVNRQLVDTAPFLRLKVRIRPEIVTFDPEVAPGPSVRGGALSPLEFNRLIERDDVQLVDTRNHYECRLGSFEGAIDPGTESFTDFKDYARDRLDPDRPVAMFCTGGVRCEKASLWLESNGFDQVFQLHGGILGYLAEVPVDQSRWRGECFVFDDRVSVGPDLQPTGRVACSGCRRPAAGLDSLGLPPVDDNLRCTLCDEGFTPSRWAGLNERARQVALGRARGQSHLGPQPTQDERPQRRADR